MSGLRENMHTLSAIGRLKKDWNGNGADGFSDDFILHCKNILNGFTHQPNVFPTASNSIQFEWYQNDLYLELEIFTDKTYRLYKETTNSKETKTLRFEEIYPVINNILK